MNIRVLIADESTIVCDTLSTLLNTAEDIELVGTASNGSEVLEQARQLCPDIVIMDIDMPNLDGIQATYDVRKICPSTEIIILSIHNSELFLLKALEAGAKGYVLKEFAGRDILEAVRVVNQKRRYLPHFPRFKN